MSNCFLSNGLSLCMRSKSVSNFGQIYEGVGKGEVKMRKGKRRNSSGANTEYFFPAV